MTWLSVSADNVVILILLLALAVKFIFFEERGDVVARRLRFKEKEEEEEEVEETTVEEKVELLDGPNNLEDMDTTMNIWLRERFGITLPTIQEPVFPLSGVGGGWGDENDVECVDKEVQTDSIYHGASDSDEIDSSPRKSEILRSVEDCLEIYKSEVRK